MIEINFNDVINNKLNLKEILDSNIVIIRDSPIIKLFRKNLISNIPKKYQQEIVELYEKKVLPSEEAIYSLRNALHFVRDLKHLSTLLYDFIFHSFSNDSILVDGGISRLLFPENRYKQLKNSSLFKRYDFQRERGSSKVETFMNGESNIHRDFNRLCSVSMYNLWIPMHDMNEDDVLSIYPNYFKEDIFDMDNTQENRDSLKNKSIFELKFGDFLIFNSEQLHHSPLRNVNTTVRHSFDFRVMINDHSDGAHYRENFDNLNNFSIPTPIEASHSLTKDLLSLKREHCNSKILFYQYKMKILTKENLFLAYQKLPFSEDRYFNLALYNLSDIVFVKKVSSYIEKNTQNYFWIYKLYKLSIYIKNREINLLDESISLSQEFPLNFSHNINYISNSKEIDYKFLLQKKLQKCKDLVIIAKDADINIDEALGKIVDANVIAPADIEKYLTYLSNVNLIAILDEDIKPFLEEEFIKVFVIFSNYEDENIKVYNLMKKLKITEFTLLNTNTKHKVINKYISPLAQIEKSVKIAENTFIGDNVTIDEYTTIKNNIIIGKATGISTHVHIYNDCQIGRFCAIGANSVIAGPPHHINTISISNKLQFKNLKPFRNYTTIGNDVWIGANVTIKANITIGDGAVIGANSFVNQDIPAYSIVYGSPAKVETYRFKEDTRSKLLELKWWEIEDINKYVIDANIEIALTEIRNLKRK